MNKIKLLFSIILLCSMSCTKETMDINFKNAFDCEFEARPNFVGMCLNGSENALRNETLTYAAKATSNFSEIQWEIEFGDMDIIDIENSNDSGNLRSIATIQFNSNFNGGSIRVFATESNSVAFAEISNYEIALEN